MNKIEFFDINDKRYDIVKKIRINVFTNEQGANADEEFDAYDQTSVFALLFENEFPVATARISQTDKGKKIGRIAVEKQCRGKGYGAVIVNAVTQKAFESGVDVVYVDAQNYAVPFYEKLGFVVTGGQLYDRGLPHIQMSIKRENFYGKEE